MTSAKRQRAVKLGENCFLSYEDGVIKVTPGSGTPLHSESSTQTSCQG